MHTNKAGEPIVTTERHGSSALVTLNRPEARNAVSGEVTESVTEVLDDLEADTSVRVVVLTGAGEVFSAGADLKLAAEGKIDSIAHPDYGFAGVVQRNFPKPLIAAVNGPALAGGFEIVLSCDLVVAGTDSRFGIPEVKRGLIAAAGGVIRLPRRVPTAVALELAMTGDPIDAERARVLGLVNRVVEPGGVVDEALSLADRIAANAPLAVRNSRRIMRESVDLEEDAAWDFQKDLLAEVFSHPDALEGPLAFAEKRDPAWTSG
ncbi:MAG: crotonase/enoyl-CoA hydratase family protein [Acidimicrobiia bacterium]